MPDEAAQPEEQRCCQEDVRSRDHQPHPPKSMPQQIPVRMSANERQDREDCGGCERERRRVVACLARRGLQAIRITRDRSRVGGIGAPRHPGPEWKHDRTAATQYVHRARTGEVLAAAGRRSLRKQSPSGMALKELVILSTNLLLFWMGAWT